MAKAEYVPGVFVTASRIKPFRAQINGHTLNGPQLKARKFASHDAALQAAIEAIQRFPETELAASFPAPRGVSRDRSVSSTKDSG